MMRMTSVVFAIGAALATFPTASHGARPKAIDPKGTYVLFELRNQSDIAVFGKTVPASMMFARYDPVNRDIRGGNKAAATALPKGEMLRVQIGLKTKPLVKTKTSRLYLVPITPDLWVIEAANGTSYSLGSLTFTAKQGDVIDLGVVEPRGGLVEGEKQENINTGSLFKMALFVRMPAARKNMLEMRARTAADLQLPKELAGRTLTIPRLSYGATFGNYAGGLINRIDGRAGRGRAADTVTPGSTPAPQ